MNKNKKDDVTIAFHPNPPGPEVEGESIILLDDEGKFVEAHSYGNFIERIEGGVRLTRPDGSTISMIDGEITIDNLVPKSVGIRDFSDIESFVVRTEEQTRICCVGFCGGGHIEVAYSQEGQVLGFRGRNFKQQLTKDNEIIVGRRDSVGDQAL